MSEHVVNPPDPGGKIFVVSLHRVVTRSTDMLLSMLGYNTVHYPKFYGGRNLHDAVKGLEEHPERVVDVLTPVIEENDALSDVPFPTLYRELDQRWPGSRFILANRDPHSWVKGVRTMLRDRKLSPFVRVQYAPYIGPGHDTILGISDAELLEMYFEHFRRVQTYFNEEIGEPQKLITVSVADPEPGEAICRFLGHDPLPMPRISGKDPKVDLRTADIWIEACPDNPDAHYLQGKALFALGRHRESLPVLERSLVLGPDNAKAHLFLYRIHERAGRRREARDHAEKAIALGMRNKPNLYFKAGLGAFARGQVRRGGRHVFWGLYRSLVSYK